MGTVGTETRERDLTEVPVARRRNWFAAGGVIGAVLASTCCIAPLLLLALGVSGAWIGNLTALEPYKPYFVGAAIIFIGLGLRQAYSTARPACADGSYCARPQSSLVTTSALWLAVVLVALALTIGWWAPFFY